MRYGSIQKGKAELELQKSLLSFSFAFRHRALCLQEVNCLKELESVISQLGSDYEGLMPAILLTRWAAAGKRDTQLLDKALSLFGAEVTGCEERLCGGLLVIFGDLILSPDDVPILISRATDHRAGERVRVASLSLLGWLAPSDERVHNIYKDLLNSDSQPEGVRLAAADGMPLLIERQGSEGVLLQIAKARLTTEKSRHVVDALTCTISRLATCP